jgi:sigma-B regulation protein RsbU (phosphoserine phosphatase)
VRNPFTNSSPRWIRIRYTTATGVILVIALISFASVMVYNVTGNDQCAWRDPGPDKPGLLITDVVPGGVTDAAGVRNGDILLEVNRHEFRTANEAQKMINAITPGEFAIYTIDRNGLQFETRVQILKVFNLPYLAMFSLGFGFLIVGYVVVMTKPQGEIQRRFARYSMLTMLFFGTAGNPQSITGLPMLAYVMSSAIIIGRLFAPPTFIRFFFYFPDKLEVARKRWVTVSLYVFSALVLLPLLLQPTLELPTGVIQSLAAVPTTMFFLGLGIFVSSYMGRVEPDRRRQLRPILVGIAIGTVAGLYLLAIGIINPFAVFLNPTLFIPALFIVTVPIAFGFSIFRYRLMDIDLVVKRSLIYGSVTATLVAIYLFVVLGAGHLIFEWIGVDDNRALNIVALVLIALVFDPVKRRAQSWIDRAFYHERLDYQRALLEFSQELPRQMNLEQIMNSVVNRIANTMHVDNVAVITSDQHEGCFCISQNIDPAYCQFADGHESLISLYLTTRKPQSFALISEEPESVTLNAVDREKIIKAGVVLGVPMFLQDRLLGTINVGPKRSGKVYSQEDINLLSTVASQAAIAIENARLHRSEIERQKIEEEMTLARRIQEGLLPKSDPNITGLDVAGLSIPARSVGGDYYDYIQLGPKKLLVVVGDVSGKGMSAALYMSKIQGMIQLAAHANSSPREMLVQVNRHLYEGIERRSFITMVLALFDLERGEVRICRAGHNKVIFGANGHLEHLDAHGIGLGLERGPIFDTSLQEVRRPITRDNIFLFYSDGLCEAMNEQQEEFSTERVCELLTHMRSLPAHDVRDALVNAVRRHQGAAEQHDDITMIVVKST